MLILSIDVSFKLISIVWKYNLKWFQWYAIFKLLVLGLLLFCALVGFTFCIHCSADFFLSLRQLYVYCGRSSSLSEIIKIWNSPNSPKLPNNTIICLKDMNFWMHWHLWFKLSVLKYHFCLSTGNYVPEKKSFNYLYLKGTSKSCVLHNLHVFSTVVEKIKEWHGYNISWIFIMLGFF